METATATQSKLRSGAGDLPLLTCITCRVGFRDGDMQREHYKSDWHRYNLKRLIVKLPPVTAENFKERLDAQEALSAGQNQEKSCYCTICKKSFGSEKAFRSHQVSKKHVQAVKEESLKHEENGAQIGGSSLVKGVEDYCIISEAKTSSSLKAPMKKSQSQTSKPLIVEGKPSNEVMEVDSEDDGDDGDWEEVEGDPIPITNCLFCSTESSDVESNLEHMSVAHSFFIPDVEYCVDVEGLLEYLGSKVGEGMMCLWCNEKGRSFYTVPSVQQHMQDKGHCKILHDDEAVFEYTDFYDYSSSYPEGCGGVNPDEVYQPEALQFNDNMQLVLPSGVTLGHRALKIYYKQYIRPTSQLALRKATKKHNILAQYKAIGYGQTALSVAQQKHRDQKVFKRARDKFMVKVGVKGNKNLQHHFRNQIMF